MSSHLALKGLAELTGPAVTADWILHTASPILGVLGWVVFGPRWWVTGRIVKLSVLFSILWLAYTLVRGALVEDRTGRNFYPYPFLDVVEHGYARVAAAIVLVAMLFFVLALGLARLAVEAIRDGVLNEGYAAWLAATQAERATDSRVRDTLLVIARDEAEHAEVSAAVLAWRLAQGDADVVTAVVAAAGLSTHRCHFMCHSRWRRCGRARRPWPVRP